MKRIADLYFQLLKLLMVLCMIAMVIMVFGNVVMRYAFNSGITLSEELSRWCFVWMVFFGALVALREKGHLGVDMLLRRMPAFIQRACLLVGHLLMIYFSWLIFSGSWDQVQINLHTPAPASGLPMAVFYACGVLFGISAGLILLCECYRLLRGGDEGFAEAPVATGLHISGDANKTLGLDRRSGK